MILACSNSRWNDLPPEVDTQHGERRCASRSAADFVVQIEIPGRGKSRAWAVDIGLGGMFIETDDVPPYASFVLVTVGEHAPSAPIRIPAIVRWTTPHGFGVQFGLLGVRETQALLALTSGLSKDEEEAVTMMRTQC
jgi:hypothetical protein